MENTQTIYELHEDHKTWLNKLLFYTDELSIMNNRISEVAMKNSAEEVLSSAEHFKDQIRKQKEQVDILSQGIKDHEAFLEKAAEDHPATIEKEKFPDHQKHRSGIEAFEKSYNGLRADLIHFLSRWM
ncbi:hypothetical protein [Chryseobacterium sp.]|uniref:hypothetical protein n=1 Tax=Chryseobacterium sp. TaxID=1871047 RepID=UPI0011CCAAAF|nr:hypothetical protein [Chryseobacterium sp.]TXF79467.1 hypothetical protein FUA25_03525 [Chryseobacterium sp.]